MIFSYGNCTQFIYLMISSPLFSQVSLSEDIIIHVLNFLDWCSDLLNSSISVFCPMLWEISWSLSQLTYWNFYLCNHIFRVPCLLFPFCNNTFLFHWCNVFFNKNDSIKSFFKSFFFPIVHFFQVAFFWVFVLFSIFDVWGFPHVFSNSEWVACA